MQTINLFASYYRVLEYEPQPGGVDLLRVLVSGTADELEAAKRAVGAELVQGARFEQKKIGVKPYIVYTPSGSGKTWRSPILGGEVYWGPQARGLEWADLQVEMVVRLEREDYFEENVEQELSISNHAGAGTGGLAVWNDDNVTITRANWINVSAANAISEIEAGVRLTLENENGAQVAFRNIFLGHKTVATTQTNMMLQFENAGGGTLYSGIDTDLASGGQYKRFTLNTSEALLATWNVDPDSYGGLKFRIIARWYLAPPDGYVRFALSNGGSILWSSAEVRLDTDKNLQSMCDIQLPPQLGGLSTLQNATFVMYGRSISGTQYLDADMLVLMPLDGFKKLNQLGGGLQAGETLVVDDIDRYVYALDGSSNKYTLWTSYGAPLRLSPGLEQIYYFIFDEALGEMYLDRQFTARLYYRRRVRTP
jgi:hypothetical protein